MIYYFSAEGNSEFVARRLAGLLHDKAARVTDMDMPEPFAGERVGLVFPVHGWGVPLPMLRFIRTHGEMLAQSDYVWGCMTCGDDCGLTHEQLAREIEKVGGRLSSAYSVTMPNTYLLMPGFSLDDRNVVSKKLRASIGAIDRVASGVTAGAHETLVNKGAMPWLKSRVLYPLFVRYKPRGKKWHCNRQACVRCGICATTCPQDNISYGSDGFPQWGNDCISCLGCYHNCPKRAIDYGRVTRRHGQYTFNKGVDTFR